MIERIVFGVILVVFSGLPAFAENMEDKLLNQRQQIRVLNNSIDILKKGNSKKEKQVNEIDLEMKLFAAKKVKESLEKGVVPDLKWMKIAKDGVKAKIGEGSQDSQTSMISSAQASVVSPSAGANSTFTGPASGLDIEPVMLINGKSSNMSVVFSVDGKYSRVKKGQKIPGYNLKLVRADKDSVLLYNGKNEDVYMTYGQKFNPKPDPKNTDGEMVDAGSMSQSQDGSIQTGGSLTTSGTQAPTTSYPY